MERLQEKCVFRGLLFYWYKVSIFNHTQSMRVIYYIILKLNHGRDLFSTFTWCYLLCVPFTFQSVDEILCCYHSNETSSVVLSHGSWIILCHFISCRVNSSVRRTPTELVSAAFFAFPTVFCHPVRKADTSKTDNWSSIRKP